MKIVKQRLIRRQHQAQSASGAPNLTLPGITPLADLIKMCAAHGAKRDTIAQLDLVGMNVESGV